MRIPGFADQAPWAIVKRAVKDFLDDDMATYAAALSFHLLLALFPFVIFLLTLLGSVGLAAFFDRLLGQARAACRLTPTRSWSRWSSRCGTGRGRGCCR